MCYAAGMDDRAYWTRALQKAGRKLDAAKGRTAVNAAARKLQRERAELKRLDESEPSKEPKPRVTTRARGPASA